MGRRGKTSKKHVWGTPAPYPEFPVGSKEYVILRTHENFIAREREATLALKREHEKANPSPPEMNNRGRGR